MTKKMKTQTHQKFGFAIGQDDNKFNVDGFCIHPGEFHGYIEIPENEMQNAASTVRNSKFIRAHQYGLTDAIGHVYNSEVKVDPSNGILGVHYDAYIDENLKVTQDDQLIYRIQNGLIDATSIGFEFDPVCAICGEDYYECPHWIFDDGFGIIATNINVYELSLVLFGADGDATVKSMNTKMAKQFKKQLVAEFEQNKKTEKFNIKNFDKSDKMANNEEVITLQEKLEALTNQFESFKEEKDAEILEARKTLSDELKAEYEEKILTETEKALTLAQEKEAAEQKLQENEDELESYREKEAAEAEARLADKEEKLLEYHKKFTDEDTLEGIDEMTEESIDKHIEMYEKIEAKAPTRPQKLNDNPQVPYRENEDKLEEQIKNLDPKDKFALALKAQFTKLRGE